MSGDASATARLQPTGSMAMTLAGWKTAIGNAHWDIDYAEFCRRAGFAEDNYSDTKWEQWLALVKLLAAFDADTLERIVNP